MNLMLEISRWTFTPVPERQWPHRFQASGQLLIVVNMPFKGEQTALTCQCWAAVGLHVVQRADPEVHYMSVFEGERMMAQKKNVMQATLCN